MSASISIVIPTYNRADVVERTLRAYGTQKGTPSEYEIVVVDDGSTDETASIVAEFCRTAPVRSFVITQRNSGPATARNAGLRAARGTIVLFGGDDVIPNEDLVYHHLLAHATSPEPSTAVLGRIVWSDDQEITPFMRWLEDEGMQFAFGSIDDPSDLPAEMYYSSNVSMHAETVRAVGWFDERFTGAAWEDVELGIRLRKHGVKLRYCPSAVGKHLHPTSFARFAGRTRRAGYFHAMMIEKHRLNAKRKRWAREAVKLVLGQALRRMPVSSLRRLGYRWALSWEEFLGMNRYRRESVKRD